MPQKLWVIDAFADRLFSGNPAGVMVLADWPADGVLQSIAAENNLAETAFCVAKAPGVYHLRWFTPTTEVLLCGHATLATSYVLWHHLDVKDDPLTFETLSGPLVVRRDGDAISMDFPADPPTEIPLLAGLAEALGAVPEKVLAGQYVMAVFDDAETVRGLQPDLRSLSRLKVAEDNAPEENCVIATAQGGEPNADFISRFFGPSVGIDEDPVTGSAHCMLAPYWASILGRSALRGYQASERGGWVGCRLEGARVHLIGRAVTYLEGQIALPSSS